MKKNTAIVWGVVVILIIVGLLFYANRNGSMFSNGLPSNSTTSTDNTPVTPPVTPSLQPSVPTVVTGSSANPTDTTVVVTGSVTPNGSFTNYWYEFGLTSALGSKTVDQAVGSGYAAVGAPFFITGLTKDTTYYFRLVAQNGLGKTLGAAYSFQTTHGNPSPVGSSPTIRTLPASNMTSTSVTFNGEVTSNKAATQYWFEYGSTRDLGNTTPLVGIGDSAVKLLASLRVGNLDSSNTYYFRMFAQNQFGTVAGAILNFKTNLPANTVAPSATTRDAIDVATTTATLRATVNPNGGEMIYWFEYSTNSGFDTNLLKTTTNTALIAGNGDVAASKDVMELIHSTTYYFRVVARNEAGTVKGSSVKFKTK